MISFTRIIGLCAALVFASTLSSCAAWRTEPKSVETNYVLVYLKTGPNSGKQSQEESQKTFAGHMANIQKLADGGNLLIAGPFDHPRDKDWRGIFLMNTPSLERARALVATDPGVQAGVFEFELHPVRASDSLKLVPELEFAMLMEISSKKTDPPPSIRSYVMITAADGARASEVLARSRISIGRVVWCARFTDGTAHRGLFVIDATKAADVQAVLDEQRTGTGEFGADGWYSSVSLTGLPREVGVWPKE